MRFRLIALCLAAGSLLIGGCSGSDSGGNSAGAFGSIDVFPLPGGDTQPFGITAGPDGNIWFTEATGNHVGKMSVDGELLDRYEIPSPDSNSQGLVAGYDDRIWFTECNPSKIAAVTADGEFTEFPTPTPKSSPCSITQGPDDKLWFASFEGNLIGSITSEGAIEEFVTPTKKAGTYQVTAGRDEDLWLSENLGDAVTRFTLQGGFEEYPLQGNRKSDVAGVAVAPDGTVWFAETTGNLIGKLVEDSASPTGRVLTKYPMPRPDTWPYDMIVGPDGNIWFTEIGGDRIARADADGQIREWRLPAGSVPRDLTVGPDGNIWIALSGGEDDVLDVRGSGKPAIARFSLEGAPDGG